MNIYGVTMLVKNIDVADVASKNNRLSHK